MSELYNSWYFQGDVALQIEFMSEQIPDGNIQYFLPVGFQHTCFAHGLDSYSIRGAATWGAAEMIAASCHNMIDRQLQNHLSASMLEDTSQEKKKKKDKSSQTGEDMVQEWWYWDLCVPSNAQKPNDGEKTAQGGFSNIKEAGGISGKNWLGTTCDIHLPCYSCIWGDKI